MKKILKGFTLAEVLITLGVIGVIAALTLPSLSLNVQKQQIGPALAKAINTLEYANKLALEENRARKLSELVGDVDKDLSEDEKHRLLLESYLEKVVGPYMKLSKLSHQITYVGSIFGATQNITQNTDVYATPDNIYYLGNYSHYHNGISIFVDVNGSKGPNLGGRDLLALWVFDDGEVVGRGGRVYTSRTDYSNDDAFVGLKKDNPTLSFSEDRCNEAKRSWIDCAGRIADNEFRVDY